MKKIIYFLAALMALSVTACKDDDVVFNNVDDLDRLPMPMFRRKFNTNVSDEGDPYASRVMDGHRNAIQLYWYGVDGAKEYEIRYAPSLISDKEEDWMDPSRNVTTVIVPADRLHYEIYNLEYQTSYGFAIRAIHPTDPSKNSKWYGLGNTGQWEDYLQIQTNERYAVPNVLDTRNKDYHEFDVVMNLNWKPSDYDSQDADTIVKRFNIVDDKFVATHLIVKASPINPTAVVPAEFEYYKLQPEDLKADAEGYSTIHIDGLSESSLYIIALYDETNTKAQADVDRYYNYGTIRTKGDPGKDILIPHKVATSIWIDPEADAVDMDQEQLWFDGEREFQACRIDTVFRKFAADITLAEGQTFLLEGGKAYYIRNGKNLNKGFTLKTDPKDILLGKGRAKVYLGGICRKGPKPGDDVQSVNWEFGKEKGPKDFNVPIKVESVIFQDIDFDIPLARNYGMQEAGEGGRTDTYFANNIKTSLGFEFESFQMRNCTFQRMIRGFFRAQGDNKKVFNQIIVDNCVFFNLGFRGPKGMDYRFIHGEGENAEDNIGNDIQITNNTFYDTTLAHLVSPAKDGPKKTPKESSTWNIRVENNTFVNVSTRSNIPLLAVRKIPGNSKITFKRNLISLARDANDKRDLIQGGMDLQQIFGSGILEIDIRDNYSTGCVEAHMVDDGIFKGGSSKGTAFSATSKSAGQYPHLLVPDITPENLIVRVGSTPLRTDELFSDPNPKYHASGIDDVNPLCHYTDPETIWSRLQYKNDLKVTTHEIYTKNIGDQRWKTSDPKWFYPAGAPVPSLPAEPETPAE